MAKKKKGEVEPIIEEAMAVDEALEEEVVEVAEPVIEEETRSEDDLEKFIYTQLKVINKMSNSAKARRLAERVLRNRKG